METVFNRFLRYVAFDTQSDEASESCPSTEKQKLLGQQLAAEIEEARREAKGIVEQARIAGEEVKQGIIQEAHTNAAALMERAAAEIEWQKA